MGHYDNDKGCYINLPEMKNGLWLVHEGTGELYILARDGDNYFETLGANDEIIEALHSAIKSNSLSDCKLEDNDIIEPLGFTYLCDWQRRFNSESGYYYA